MNKRISFRKIILSALLACLAAFLALSAYIRGITPGGVKQAGERTLYLKKNSEALCFWSECIKKYGENYFAYYVISTPDYTVKKGDFLEYDIMIPEGSPDCRAGIDLGFSDGQYLRDLGIKDTRGAYSHPYSEVPKSIGNWLHRKIPLGPAQGRVITKVDLAQEGDKFGSHMAFFAGIRITNTDGPGLTIYKKGNLPEPVLDFKNGYGENVFIVPVTKETAEARNTDKIEAGIKRQFFDRLEKQPPDKALCFLSECISRGAGNFFVYHVIYRGDYLV